MSTPENTEPITDPPSASDADAGSPSPETTTPAPPTPPAPAGEARTITIPTSEMGRIKAASKEKGKAEAALEFAQTLEKLSQHLGFSSVAEMMAANPEERRQKRQDSAPTTPRNEDPPMQPPKKPTVTDPNADYARLVEQNRILNRQAAANQRRVRLFEARLQASEAEHQLRIAATRAGVQDVDYALHRLRQDMAGKTPQELAAFDENAYFSETLRKSTPHIYATTTVPATTGTTGETPSAAPAAPGPDAPVTQEKDARKMSNEEYEAALRKYGLRNPASSP